MLSPPGVFNRRDLGRLYLAAAAPEDVRVENRNPCFLEMVVDGRLVREHQIFIRTVRHGHNVHVAELWPALAPVSVGENVVPAHFPSRFDLSSGRDMPVKEGVVSRHALTSRGRLNVLEKR